MLSCGGLLDSAGSHSLKPAQQRGDSSRTDTCKRGLRYRVLRVWAQEGWGRIKHVVTHSFMRSLCARGRACPRATLYCRLPKKVTRGRRRQTLQWRRGKLAQLRSFRSCKVRLLLRKENVPAQANLPSHLVSVNMQLVRPHPACLGPHLGTTK